MELLAMAAKPRDPIEQPLQASSVDAATRDAAQPGSGRVMRRFLPE